MNRFFYSLLFVSFSIKSVGQITEAMKNYELATKNYELAFEEMHQMLKGEAPISLKRAVFLTENAYLENKLAYEDFLKPIDALIRITKVVAANDGLDYTKKDRQQVLLAASIYKVMKDTLIFENLDKVTSFQKYPYTYDTADFWGKEDWTKMFVTKLIYKQTGNCHSLPLLYKILADELGTQAWLSITPNHTYIKQWNDKSGWYNTELTSGRFPYDAEIKNNSYIKHEAIVNGVYMDTLTVKENISYAITDLAQGYINKFGHGDIETPLRWLEAALGYYPDFPNALILKSELLKKKYESLAVEKGEKNFLKPKDGELKGKFEELEKSYYSVHQIEYRRMPREMYLNWLYRVRKDTTRKPHRFESPQPFKDYNYKVTVMTASDGYNYEFYDQEDTTRIGTVVINRLTGKILKFVDPTKDDFPDEVISRMYDPYVGRFWQVDPLTDMAPEKSPYHFVSNNPVNRIDPTGLTDFALNKRTGEISQVGDANDEPDRILKTNRHGEVKYKRNGEAKVGVAGIEKGILQDGQNFKTADQVINVGGEGQPSLGGVEDFVTRFSEYVGVEIAGAYLSQENNASANISKVYIDEYQGNKAQESTMSLTGLARLPSGQLVNPSLQGFNTITAFHTHPSNLGVNRTDVERPSGVHDGSGDLRFRDNQLRNFYNFLILTRTAAYPYSVMKIPYTNWKK